MAIHTLGLLKEFRDRDLTLEAIKGALGYTDAGGALDIDDWLILYNAISIDEVKRAVEFLIPKYEKIWNLLYQPDTAGDWHHSRYYVIKTRRKHAVKQLERSKVFIREWDNARQGYKLADVQVGFAS